MGSGSSSSKKEAPVKPVANGKRRVESRTPEQQRAAWLHFQRELPRTKSDEDKERRIDLFEKMDVTGRGSLTVREVYDGCKKILYLQDFTPRLADIVERAFNKAKAIGTTVEGTGDEDLVEFLEFRLMLCYIYDYFKLTELFDSMDTTGDMLITMDEFKQAKPSLEARGLRVGDPAATFRSIDANGSGQVTFDEFADWAQRQKEEIDAEYTAMSSAITDDNSMPTAVAKDGFADNDAAARRRAWKRIREIIPRQRTPEDKQRRIELFKKFDTDRSGALTLVETYNGCVDILHLDEFTTRLKDIVRRAYNKARSLGTTAEGAGDSSLVEFLEFRLMLCYIYDYFELTVMFDEIDTSGNMMLDKDEFKQAVPKLREWGVDIKDPEATFKEIDDNNSGQLTFDEFAAWASAVRLDIDGDPDNVH